MKDPAPVQHRVILCVLLALSCGAYFNTLQAGFTYDDFFAVVGTFLCTARRSLKPMTARAAVWGHLDVVSCWSLAEIIHRSHCHDTTLQIRNRDVTDDDKPLTDLLFNDFW
jgi:hypothetical protein